MPIITFAVEPEDSSFPILCVFTDFSEARKAFDILVKTCKPKNGVEPKEVEVGRSPSLWYSCFYVRLYNLDAAIFVAPTDDESGRTDPPEITALRSQLVFTSEARRALGTARINVVRVFNLTEPLFERAGLALMEASIRIDPTSSLLLENLKDSKTWSPSPYSF